jgi:uracil-DNA glycosylase
MLFSSDCQGQDFSELIAARRSCRICPNRNPGKIHNGSSFNFDPNVVSYWSQWLGHAEPLILIVGQDFGDTDYFEEFRGADDPENDTNQFLYELLVHIGLTPAPPPTLDQRTRVFLTNSVLCLKEPPMNSQLRDPWVRSCAINHLRPLANKLKPPIIVAMGGPAWLAAQIAFEIENVPEKIKAAAGGMWPTKTGGQVFAVGHCGRLGQGNRPWHKQLDDWSRIGTALKLISETPG